MDFRNVYGVTAGGKAVKYILDSKGRRLWGGVDAYVAQSLYTPTNVDYFFRKGYYDLTVVGGGADTLINSGHYGVHGYPSSSAGGWYGRVYVSYDRTTRIRCGCATAIFGDSTDLWRSSEQIIELGATQLNSAQFINGTSSVLGITCTPGFTVQYGEKFFSGPPFLCSVGGSPSTSLHDGVYIVNTFAAVGGSDGYNIYNSSGDVITSTDIRKTSVWQWGGTTRNYFWCNGVARTESYGGPLSAYGVAYGRGSYFKWVPEISYGGGVTANNNSYGENATAGLVGITYLGTSL